MKTKLESVRRTDLIVELFSQSRNLVEQSQTLIHPLLDHMKVSVHLKSQKPAYSAESSPRLSAMSLHTACFPSAINTNRL